MSFLFSNTITITPSYHIFLRFVILSGRAIPPKRPNERLVPLALDLVKQHFHRDLPLNDIINVTRLDSRAKAKRSPLLLE